MRRRTMTYAARLMAFIVTVVGTGAAFAQPDSWREHPQPGGGSIWLPESFSVIELAAQATSKPAADGGTTFFQDLVNAKGTNDGVVNSINTNRIWHQGADGRIRTKPSAMAEQLTRALPNLLRQQGMVLEVIDGPRAFRAGLISGWRISVSFNDGGSRIDQFAFLKGGMLYTLSAAYGMSGAKYWTAKTEQVLARWQPAAVVGDLSAIERPPISAEWKFVVLRTGERFCIPLSWVVISQDERPSKETVDGQAVTISKLLNVRPSRHTRDRSVFHVVSIAIVARASKRTVPISNADLLEFHQSMIDGTAPSLKIAKHGGPTKRQVAGATAYVTRLVGSPSTGIPVEAILFSTVREGRAYSFLASFSPGEAQEFENAIEQIISRSEFLESTPAPIMTPWIGSVGNEDKAELAAQFDPRALAAVSFLLTWGIGMTPPVLIRYVLLRRPLGSRIVAGTIAGGFSIANIMIFTALGSTSTQHMELMAICIMSYFVLRHGASKYRAGQASEPADA